MEEILKEIERLKKSEVKDTVQSRMTEFRNLGKGDIDSIFSELCFCITTANFNAERSIRMQGVIGKGYCDMPEAELARKLKEQGHRFPKARASYISNARGQKERLKEKLGSYERERELREWVADNVKGIGLKEASHFLRNIGFRNLAIIDFHIIDLLVRYGIIERPNTLTPKRYIEIEDKLKELADRTKLNLAELDMYLWYMETGKILK